MAPRRRRPRSGGRSKRILGVLWAGVPNFLVIYDGSHVQETKVGLLNRGGTISSLTLHGGNQGFNLA